MLPHVNAAAIKNKHLSVMTVTSYKPSFSGMSTTITISFCRINALTNALVKMGISIFFTVAIDSSCNVIQLQHADCVIDVKKTFFMFFILVTSLTFLTFFIFQTFFILKNVGKALSK